MEVVTIRRAESAYPLQLTRLHKPPPELYCLGRELGDIMQRPRVAIVGSRRVSPYGRQVTQQLARQLAERGVVIISGLAIGVDAIAHQAALETGGITMAVLPSPVQAPAPWTNYQLARQIVAKGGALISTYASDTVNHKGNFVERNQYVAALSDLVIITEAAHKSGSLHTATFAEQVSVPVLAVPGSIMSPTSAGTNNLLKSSKAAAVTDVADVLQALGLQTHRAKRDFSGISPPERQLLQLMARGVQDGTALLEASGQQISLFNQTLSLLEITGKVIALGGNQWGVP